MERRVIAVKGTVQGVGFRPFVYGLASRLSLNGFVNNQIDGVHIEVEGDPESLDQFLRGLGTESPPLARVDAISWEIKALRGEETFEIHASSSDQPGAVVITPDAGTCDACLKELFDPNDRRHGYAFLNCTHCGPRLTIVTGVPYDRARTTMAGFEMCAACRTEYEDPANRRFHAQPVACDACGPALRLLASDGTPLAAAVPIQSAADALLAGKIVALKGVGGFHLACDALNEQSVAELRKRKRRDEKPFAIMVADPAHAEELCASSPQERKLLTSWRRPIVLLRKHTSCAIAPNVAPGNPYLGIMLPYTPLHHLLLRKVGNRPLVMTSGNSSDEPIAYQQADAIERLGPIADVILSHNRPIHIRCDDSVTRVIAGFESPVRRSRGYSPQPIALPVQCSVPILAVGGQLKATFAIGRERQAVISHHLGDLDHFQAYQAFERDVSLYQELFETSPACIAHDLHPDYASSRYAIRRSTAEGLRRIAVQHHHAHMASCMAEHGLEGTVIGVSFDGTGYGTDGAVWGGEFLLGDYRAFQRAAHLRYIGLPGGDMAAREPWRMAAAHLLDAQCAFPQFEQRHSASARRAIERMITRRFNTPMTSSAGRLFDVVAALTGIADRVSYEGQAALALEWAAMEASDTASYPFVLAPLTNDSDTAQAPLVIDTRPIIKAIVQDIQGGASTATVARRFHFTLVEVIAGICLHLRKRTGLERVVFSGGVFMNALLTQLAEARLQREGFAVFRHRLVPPNDGGLSLGQLAVAASLLCDAPNKERRT